jgi:CheY-like chemotaxis protein
MRHENTHPPVILLLDGGPSADNKFIKRWFQKSRFLTCEAADVLQALEEISDFTTPQRPDVILLEVESIPEGFQLAKRLTQAFSGQAEFPIYAFSGSGKAVNDGECFEGNLAQLEAKLNAMIPGCRETPRTIAA